MRRPSSLAASLVLASLAAFATAEVTVYPRPRGVEPSPDYRVSADGRDVLVHHTPVCSFATFGFTGEVSVAIDVRRPVRRAVIRPLAGGIVPEVDGDTIRFCLSRPCRIAVEVDDDLRRPLFLFANGPETEVPQRGERRVRFFPGGHVHEAGRIELRDGETVYLAGGAVVRGTIRATQASRIRILGPGILDGSTREKQTEAVLLVGCEGVEIDGPIVLGSYGWSVVPRLSEDVAMRNVKIVSWRDNDDGFDPDSSRRITVENCFFRTKDDCIAIKAHGQFGASAAAMADGAPDRLDTVGVRVASSTFWSSEWGHALAVGFAVSAPAIRDVVFEDCDIIKKEKGWAMSVENHDLGVVENVRFENIRVEEGCDKLVAVKLAFSEYSADCPTRFFRNNPGREPAQGDEWERIVHEKRSAGRGEIRGIRFEDIRITGDRMPPSDIKGLGPLAQIGDVTFRNVTLRGKPVTSAEEAGIEARHAPHVTFGE